MARDSRGRFVSANVAAAELVLETAVAEAVDLLQRGIYVADVVEWGGQVVRRVRATEADHVFLAERTLLHAGHTADLLLSERAS